MFIIIIYQYNKYTHIKNIVYRRDDVTDVAAGVSSKSIHTR